jgi:hypothetical protein
MPPQATGKTPKNNNYSMFFSFLLPEPGRAYPQIQDFSHFVFISSLNKNNKDIYFIIFSD